MRFRRRKDHENYVGPGILAERHGRFLRMTSTLDEETHAEMRRELGDSVSEIRDRMIREVEDLYDVLHRYSPEAMIGALWFRNCPFGSADVATSSGLGESTIAFVEYVATLYVRDRGEGTEFVVPPSVLEGVQAKVQSLFTSTMWLWMAEDAARHGSEPPNSRRDLRFLTLMESLFVRYPGHHDHLAAILEGIDAKITRDLTERLGWNMHDAVQIAESAVALIDDRLNDSFARGREEAQRRELECWPRGDGGLARLVKRVIPPSKRRSQRKWLYGLTAWVAFCMQDATTFTTEELAQASSVSPDRVRAFLEAASLPWGSCAEDFYGLPHPTPPLQTRPVLALAEDQYMIPIPTSLLWAIRSLAEDLLKAGDGEEGKSWWHRYEKARADYSEERAVELFANAMPHAGAFHSLKYPWVQDGKTIQAELDGLVIADDVALLIEVKSGSMSQAGRRGAPDGMRRDLQALLGDPHAQTLRARDYLKSAERVEFTADGGKGLAVKSRQLSDFILVTVTLDALDIFTAILHRLTDLDVLGGQDLPWAVSLLDLTVITAAIEFPAQVVHFLRRRARLNDLAFVMAHDELDWFGHYLSEGLFFEHLVSPAEGNEAQSRFNIFGYSEELDTHFMHDARYEGDRPPLPRQYMPEAMKAFLSEMEEAQHHGYFRISAALLDLDWETRDLFFAQIEAAVQRTREDGQNHNYTILLTDGQSGMTFMCADDRDSLQRDLFGYCRVKMYQARCSHWAGIGKLMASENYLDEAVIIAQPWEHDDALEELVSQMLPPLSEQPVRTVSQ